MTSLTGSLASVVADKLDGVQTAATVNHPSANGYDTGGEGTSSGEFTVSDDGAQGPVIFPVGPGSAIAQYNDGTKVSGLGVEAYTNSTGGTVVRVGDLLIIEGQDSFSRPMTTDLLRKMAPHLR